VLNNGKPWAAVNSPTPTAEEQSLQQSGPAGYLKLLANVDGNVYDDGAATVNGVSTKKYTFRVNFLTLLGPTFRQLYPQLTDQEIKQTGLDNLPMSVWLDRDGVTRKLQVSFKYQSVSVSAIAFVTPSTKVINLTPPPASQVNVLHSLKQLAAIEGAATASAAGAAS
jgi:hypothetical protein